MNLQEPHIGRAAATASNLRRTVFVDDSSAHLQVFTGALVLALIWVLMVIGQPQPYAWIGIAFGLALFGFAVSTPRLRVDVSEGGVDLYEIHWWKTKVHRLTADRPAPHIDIHQSASGAEDVYYFLKLTLPSGRKIKLRQKRREQLQDLTTTILQPWPTQE